MAATLPLTRKRQTPATDFRGVSAEWLRRDRPATAHMTRLSAYSSMTCSPLGGTLRFPTLAGGTRST